MSPIYLDVLHPRVVHQKRGLAPFVFEYIFTGFGIVYGYLYALWIFAVLSASGENVLNGSNRAIDNSGVLENSYENIGSHSKMPLFNVFSSPSEQLHFTTNTAYCQWGK